MKDKLKKLIQKKWSRLPRGSFRYWDAKKDEIEMIYGVAPQEKWDFGYDQFIMSTENIRRIASSTLVAQNRILELKRENNELKEKIAKLEKETNVIVNKDFNVHIANMKALSNSILEDIKYREDFFKEVSEDLNEQGFKYSYNDVIKFVSSYGYDKICEIIYSKDEKGDFLLHWDAVHKIVNLIKDSIAKCY